MTDQEFDSERETITLNVYKNSPCIWAGGLEGEALADWLKGRANALLSAIRHHEMMDRLLKESASYQNTASLAEAYASLGLCFEQGSDPSRPLSTAAVQYDQMASERLHTIHDYSPRLPTPRSVLTSEILPGCADLPDLHAAAEVFREKRCHQSSQVATGCEQRAGD